MESSAKIDFERVNTYYQRVMAREHSTEQIHFDEHLQVRLKPVLLSSTVFHADNWLHVCAGELVPGHLPVQPSSRTPIVCAKYTRDMPPARTLVP